MRPDQRFFQHTRLRIGAVEHGNFAPHHAATHRLPDFAHDVLRFVEIIEGGIKADQRAVITRGPQLLAQAVAVLCNDRIGSSQNGAGGTVILLQPDDLGDLQGLTEQFADVLKVRQHGLGIGVALTAVRRRAIE